MFMISRESDIIPVMLIISLAIASGLLQIGGYLVYGREVFSGKIRPNTASWGIWAFGAVLESASYIALTGDLLKNILPITCAISVVIFFIICLKRGYFEPLDRFEKIIVIADLITITIWWLSQSAFYANVLAILTAFISFIPIIRHAWKNPNDESAFPWFIWTAAYTTQASVVLLRWTKWEDMLYPALFMVLHFTVAILAINTYVRRKSQRRKTAGTAKNPIASA